MAKRGKPEGNKRQRERDKRRKKEEKALRKKMRKEGTLGMDVEGDAGEAPGPDAASSEAGSDGGFGAPMEGLGSTDGGGTDPADAGAEGVAETPDAQGVPERNSGEA